MIKDKASKAEKQRGLAVSISSRRGEFMLQLDEQFADHGITAIFGPSGSGKSTLLNMIAGFAKPDSGARITFADETWFERKRTVAVHKRHVAYVTQRGALLPHLDVERNLAYAQQRARRVAPGESVLCIEEASELFGVQSMLQLMPAALSGGQQQRVAICRAVLSNPRLLLLDEPLSALDAASREQTLLALEALHAFRRIPCLYVTHNHDEVMRLADRIMLIQDGRVLQHADAAHLLSDASVTFGDTGERGVILQGRMVASQSQHGLAEIEIGGSRNLLCLQGAKPLYPGQNLRARIYARDVSIALSEAADSSILNSLPASVDSIHIETGGRALLTLDLEGQKLLSLITQRSVEKLALHTGQRVFAQVKGIAITGARD
ncbi:MAG: molybdenum ABC transporter ATP-binding protein [Pseudomonadales bacterium]